jgi:hypothetical protein
MWLDGVLDNYRASYFTWRKCLDTVTYGNYYLGYTGYQGVKATNKINFGRNFTGRRSTIRTVSLTLVLFYDFA